MILSYSRNFVFIKTRKTAGTSIEIALSNICSNEDIITPISPDDEIVRQEREGAAPRNFSNSSAHEIAYQDAIKSRDINKIEFARRNVNQSKQFWNHMSASMVRDKVTDQFWRNAFKFTIERHPYEKVISQAYFRFAQRPPGNLSFAVFLDSVVKEGGYRNLDLYCDDRGPIIDRILKFEELPHCLQSIAEHIGADISLNLPRTKHKFRIDRRPAEQILTEPQKKVVVCWCKAEFDLLNYRI